MWRILQDETLEKLIICQVKIMEKLITLQTDLGFILNVST